MSATKPVFKIVHQDLSAQDATSEIPSEPNGYKGAVNSDRVLIDVALGGPDAMISIVAYVWNGELGCYVKLDETGPIRETKRLQLLVDAPEDLLLLPVEVEGRVTVAVAGV